MEIRDIHTHRAPCVDLLEQIGKLIAAGRVVTLWATRNAWVKATIVCQVKMDQNQRRRRQSTFSPSLPCALSPRGPHHSVK